MQTNTNFDIFSVQGFPETCGRAPPTLHAKVRSLAPGVKCKYVNDKSRAQTLGTLGTLAQGRRAVRTLRPLSDMRCLLPLRSLLDITMRVCARITVNSCAESAAFLLIFQVC